MKRVIRGGDIAVNPEAVNGSLPTIIVIANKYIQIVDQKKILSLYQWAEALSHLIFFHKILKYISSAGSTCVGRHNNNGHNFLRTELSIYHVYFIYNPKQHLETGVVTGKFRISS